MRHELAPGILLIANPTLRDPNFSRSVVLLCEHDEQGSMGLVVNRPSELSLGDTLSDVGRAASQRLYWGGPVQRDVIVVLHRGELEVPGARALCDGMALGGDEEALLDLLRGPGRIEERVRVFAGYAGWSAGQLQNEMRDRGWIIAPGRARFVFETESAEMWSTAVRSLGPSYAYLATMPPDPRVN